MKYLGERLGVSPPWKTRGMTWMADAGSSVKVCEKNRQLKVSVTTMRADAQPLAGARGFTLIEFLVSFSNIALLMSLVLPAVNKARKSARRIECANRAKNAVVSVSVLFVYLVSLCG